MREHRKPSTGVLRRLRAPSGDSGLTVIELMVSLVVFSIAAAGLAAGFNAAVKTSGNDRNRLAAANLAQRELEIVRNAFTATESGPLEVIDAGSATNPHPLPGGTEGEPLVVDGRPYTVTRSLSWLVAENGASSCDGGSSAQFPKLALGVTVTWPSMGSIPPVRANTILTPPRGILNSTLTFVAVKVIGASGQDQDGLRVRIVPDDGGAVTTTYTEPDGCAVFGLTSSGLHTVWLDETDHVDQNGKQEVSKTVNVSPSAFQRVDFSYDGEARVQVRQVTDPGYTVPAGFGHVTLGSTVFTNQYRSFPAGTVASTIADLWPMTSGYEVWAGSCEQSDPVPLGGARGEPVIVGPGATSTVADVRLAPVDLTVTASGLPLAGVEVAARPVVDTGCQADELEVNLGSTDATGLLKVALPAGAWDLFVLPDSEDTQVLTTDVLLPTDAPHTYTLETA